MPLEHTGPTLAAIYGRRLALGPALQGDATLAALPEPSGAAALPGPAGAAAETSGASESTARTSVEELGEEQAS
ncbi:MAG: hypothetical protein V9H69_03680 [Anaerolineae bacterium]